MGRVEPESFWLGCPCFADVFVWREAPKRLEAPGEVVGRDEVGQMASQLVVTVIVVSLDGRLLDGPVHAFDLPVGPGVMRLGQPMLDAVALAGPIEGVAAEHRGRARPVLRQIGELDAVVR